MISKFPRKISKLPQKISKVPQKISKVPQKISKVPQKISKVPQKSLAYWCRRTPRSLAYWCRRTPRNLAYWCRRTPRCGLERLIWAQVHLGSNRNTDLAWASWDGFFSTSQSDFIAIQCLSKRTCLMVRGVSNIFNLKLPASFPFPPNLMVRQPDPSSPRATILTKYRKHPLSHKMTPQWHPPTFNYMTVKRRVHIPIN